MITIAATCSGDQANDYRMELGVQLFPGRGRPVSVRPSGSDQAHSRWLVPVRSSGAWCWTAGGQLLRRNRTGRICPANIVPGIDFPTILAAWAPVFVSGHAAATGGPISQIPINQSLPVRQSPARRLQRQIPRSRVNYEPSSLQDDSPRRRVPASAAIGARRRAASAPAAGHLPTITARHGCSSTAGRPNRRTGGCPVFELSRSDPQCATQVGQLRHVSHRLPGGWPTAWALRSCRRRRRPW